MLRHACLYTDALLFFSCSYVAVTGLPDPQPDHAVIMVKFARDCYAILNKLLSSLVESLGQDVMNLNFRVGLHSGAITGGGTFQQTCILLAYFSAAKPLSYAVLRGQKSRFQLFGDTINTASRMESTGIPGRIHVSQECADELEKHGLKRWLTPRQDKVQAKGKGELQTYFVSIQREAYSMVSGMTPSTQDDNNEYAEDDEVEQARKARISYEEIQKSLATEAFKSPIQRPEDWEDEVSI